MTVGLLEVLGLAMALGTAILLFVVSWDLGDDFKSMDRRLDRRDARRGARHGSDAGGGWSLARLGFSAGDDRSDGDSKRRRAA